MAIVYRHRRLDNMQPFYIGIGKEEQRAYSKKNRNKHWLNTVNKNGYLVEILFRDINLKEACELEIFLIEEYGRNDLGDGYLVNMTNGGDGVSGKIFTEEYKEKISKSLLGNKRALGHKHDEETKKKMRENSRVRGKKLSLGKKASESTKIKMSLKRIGSKNPSAIKIQDTNTLMIFGTMKEASEFVGLKYTTLSAMLNGHCRNKTNLIKLT